MVRESDANTGADYRLVSATDARGNPTHETFAGGHLGAVRTYQPQTGQVASIRYGNLGNAYLRQLNYTYDVFGNLAEQVLDAGLSAETYTYDALHRLTNATRQGAAAGDGSGATVTYGYDAVGNFQYKSDFSRTNKLGWYDYIPRGAGCGGGPNAVKRVTLIDGSTRSYCYDANGNMTGDDAGLALQYDHTQRPIKITRGAVVQHFDYGPDGQRFRRYGTEGETQYFPGIEHLVGAQVQQKTYLGSSVLVNTFGSTRRIDYLLTDRLGSVDAIADGDGALVETRGYDAFGKPRTGTWTNTSPPRIGATATTNTPRGFTGHEHLDSLELIHMNGRVYDYSVGRFTGVDPVIQFPLNSQSLNPYSYILNNPLSGTDPTGYCSEAAVDGDKVECKFTPVGSKISQKAEGTIQKDGSVKFSGANSLGGKIVNGGTLMTVNTQSNGALKSNQIDRNKSSLTSTDRVLTASGRSNSGTQYEVESEKTSVSTRDALGVMYDAGLTTEDRALLDWSARSSGKAEPFYEGEKFFAGGVAFKGLFGLGTWAGRELGWLGREANLVERASQIRNALDPIAYGRRTVAAVDTTGGRIIAGGGRDLTPAQRALLLPGETAARLPGAHAEITALRAAQQMGARPQSMGVTRTICPQCATAIEASGGKLTSPTTATWPR